MIEENPSFDKRLYKVVGHNCKLAREIRGWNRKEAQQHIWQYKNPEIFPNRISELEVGDKKIDLKTVFKLCESYGCSADFILGFSDEFERNDLAAKHAGMVFQSVRSSVLEATEQICMNVSKSITHLPPFQGEMLKASARQAVNVFKKHSHDLAFKAQYADIMEAMEEVEKNVVMFELFFAKQMRQIELSMMSMLEDEREGVITNHKLTRKPQTKKPEKV